jgi:hypothetical protein
MLEDRVFPVLPDKKERIVQSWSGALIKPYREES